MNDQVEKQTVLVVDDTPANIKVLMETLKDDYRIVAAVNGQRALQLAASDPNPDIILLDVREPEEFASGYINAHTVLTIPRGKLEFLAIEKVAKQFGQDVQIVTYCLKGARGSLAALQLQKMGFTNVKNLDGGILKWLEKGNTIHSYLGEMSLA